jgi:hypothetical protein
MNERIMELATEVGISADYLTNTKQIVLIEKFAELIIKKCVMVGNYAHDGGEYPGPMIKEYFGVES